MVKHLDVERHQRMTLAEFADLARQEFQRQRLAAGDANGAAPHALEVFDLRLHAFDVAVLPAQIVNEHLAGSGQSHAARAAFEQVSAQFLLQIHDAAVYRGCGDVEMVRGLADRAGPRDLVDIPHDA